MKQLSFSQKFPVYHPKAGQPTYFVEQIYNAINLKKCDIPEFMWQKINEFFFFDGQMKKCHTIRKHANSFKPSDYFKPMVWAGKPYHKTDTGLWQLQFAPPIQVKKTWNLDIANGFLYINKLVHCDMKDVRMISDFARNDGLDTQDLLDWFKYPKKCVTDSYIICWNDAINY